MDCILKKGGAVIRFKKKSSIFQRVGGVRIIPISVRILSIFIFIKKFTYIILCLL